MYTIVTPEKIQLDPGSVVRLPGSWQDYQALVQQLGDRPNPRIKFRKGEILLMNPLPEHGRQVHILANVVTVLLDHLEQEYDAFTPITMELPEISGIEPDYCFYIDNWEAASGKNRIDWEIDPPPDLVIEVDVTSYTAVEDYLPYRVPEVWLFKKKRLMMYGLVDGTYSVQETSQFFPEMNLPAIVEDCLQMAQQRNTSAAMRALRQQLATL
ncbi:Uma2 family endonuclease [Acaryochloris sp. IP29b_bin.148]|uniref:Uma2 family endonuclease n=1 Tax=Acaryochloris sp. IP29b_bin.148 TaxID=2969218 RepID=UPI0026291DC7|nr:Uma2 family endonuclease [Acaryochloris sp. IP29b_bin.148]